MSRPPQEYREVQHRTGKGFLYSTLASVTLMISMKLRREIT